VAASYGELLRCLLEPAAAKVGADYDVETLWMYGEYARDEIAPEEVAFGLLHAGGQILVTKTHADEFPASKRRVGRKGSRLLRSALGEDQTLVASTVVARAQALLAAERLAAAGDRESAQVHELSAAFLLRYFPLSGDDIARQDGYLADSFAHARSIQLELGTDLAPQAVAAQAFQQHATLHALALALGDDFMTKNFEALILPGTGWDALVLGSADAERWGPVEETRMIYVRAGHERAYFDPAA
jgi:hypothetical protein